VSFIENLQLVLCVHFWSNSAVTYKYDLAVLGGLFRAELCKLLLLKIGLLM